MVRRLFTIIAVLILICSSQGCSTGCKNALTAYEESFFLMDTFVSLQVYADSPAVARAAIDKARAEMAQLEQILSAHNDESDLAKLTATAGIAPIKVHAGTFSLIEHAQKLAQATTGAFDITVGPVLALYSFSPGKEQFPTDEQLIQVLPLVDWQRVKLDAEKEEVFLSLTGMALDLGAVAKGYIVDCGLRILKAEGVKYGLINAGGDIGFLGPKPDGNPWKVGLKNPVNPAGNFAIIELSGGAIATSGDYERFFFAKGRRYHHIIDPRTGIPADQCRSVTILADDAELADILSTAVFVLGPKAGLSFVETLPGVDAVIWDAENKVHYSSGLTPVKANPSTDYYFRRP